MAQLQEPRKMPGRRGWQQRVRVPKPDGTGWTYKHKGGFRTKDDARAWRDQMAGVGGQAVTLADLFDRYLAVYDGADSTKKNLRWRLDKALATFGPVQPSRLTREEVERWRLTIPEGHRFETVQALRQTLRWGATAGLVERHHPALDVKNPQRKRREIQPFETWADIEKLADEVDPRYSALIIFAAAPAYDQGSGLRSSGAT